MNRTTCSRCGLEVAGRPHATADDCVAQLAPRYRLVSQSLRAMHSRYQNLEDRLERSKIAERLARKEAKKTAKKHDTFAGRLERLERLAGIGKEIEHVS